MKNSTWLLIIMSLICTGYFILGMNNVEKQILDICLTTLCVGHFICKAIEKQNE